MLGIICCLVCEYLFDGVTTFKNITYLVFLPSKTGDVNFRVQVLILKIYLNICLTNRSQYIIMNIYNYNLLF